VAIAELFWGLVNPIFITGERAVPLAIMLPVVVGVLVICGLGFWLGWIMATTKEVAPAPIEASESKEEKAE
jgi:uncharacterized membrane protein